MADLLARPLGLRTDAARNRARLLDVARGQHAAGEGLSLNAIAHEAGVGVGTAYRHFPTHQAVLEALAIDAFEAVLERARAVVDLPDPAAALRGVVAALYAGVRAEPALAEMLAQGAFTCADNRVIAGNLLGAFEALLVRARAAGVVREDVTADDVRRLVCGIRLAAAAGPRPVAEPDRYLDVLLAGLRPSS